jgi:hypothetical protein
MPTDTCDTCGHTPAWSLFCPVTIKQLRACAMRRGMLLDSDAGNRDRDPRTYTLYTDDDVMVSKTSDVIEHYLREHTTGSTRDWQILGPGGYFVDH